MAFYSVVYLAILLANIHFIRQTKKKVCIALAALHLPLWVTHSVTVTLEFVHKEWLLRLGTLQTIVQSDVWIKRETNKIN